MGEEKELSHGVETEGLVRCSQLWLPTEARPRWEHLKYMFKPALTMIPNSLIKANREQININSVAAQRVRDTF